MTTYVDIEIEIQQLRKATMLNKQKPKKGKTFLIIFALILVLFLILTIILGKAITVNLDKNLTNNAHEKASSYLMADIDYANEDTMARAKYIIVDKFDFMKKNKTYQDYYSRAEILTAQGKYNEAIEMLEVAYSLLEEDANESADDIWMQKGCVYVLLDDYDSAIDSFGNVSEDFSKLRDAVCIEAQLYMEANEAEKAIELINCYLENKEDIALRETLAQTYFTWWMHTSSARQYTHLLSITSENNGFYYMMRGMCKEQIKDYEGAIADFELAIENDCEDEYECYEHSAICSYRLEDYNKVIEYGEQAIRMASEQTEQYSLLRILGLTSIKLENHQKGIEYLSKAIEGDMELIDIYYHRGICYMAKNDYANAIIDFTKAIDNEQLEALSYYNRGICYLNIEEIECSKRDLLKVLDSDCDENLKHSAQELIETLEGMG